MRTLGDELRKFVTGTRMPNAAQCSGCGYVHLDYPGVREFLQAQDPLRRRNLLVIAQCRCTARQRQTLEEKERLVRESNLPKGGLPVPTSLFRAGPAPRDCGMRLRTSWRASDPGE